MTPDVPGNAARASDLLEQLALELAFTAAGAAVPPPIGDVLEQLTATCAAAPEPIRQAVTACRHWVAEDADLVGRHGSQASGIRFSSCPTTSTPFRPPRIGS